MSFRILILLALMSFGSKALTQVSEYEPLDKEDSHHCFLKEKSLSLGVAAPYSMELNSLGFNVRMYYNIGENICFGPEYGYFKNEEVELLDFDFVIHYIFETPWLGISPIAGLNYSIEKELHNDVTLAKPGILLGVAVHRNIENFTFFAEYTRVELGLIDDFITLGVLYTFKND